MQADRMRPYQQGKLDSLCGLYAAINAMRWATRDDEIEEAFWEEVFDSLVLCADAHVGMAHVLISGIGAKPLFKVLKEVLAEIDHRFGRRFEAHRPLRGPPTTRTDCIRDQLSWFAEQPHTAVMMIAEGVNPHWTTIKETDGRRLVLLDSNGRADLEIAEPQSPPTNNGVAGVILPKSVIVIERVKR